MFNISKNHLEKRVDDIESYSLGLGLNYQIISQEKQNVAVAFGVARAEVIFKLFNKDGSIYRSKEVKQLEKDKAKKELLELKEFLDLGLITKEEFDSKSVSLKKILLGN